jgi:two-component sensor histidine kinase
MFVNALTGLSLVIFASINPGLLSPEGDRTPVSLSAREKTAILHPLIHTATNCVARAVSADPRFGQRNVTDLIVESFKNCVAPVRAMIDAHDRYYGSGSGQQFFMGPYLDTLPAAVTTIVEQAGRK